MSRDAAASERGPLSEGLMLADAAVRMTVKNAIIVAALRDRSDLDLEALRALAAGQFGALADEQRTAVGAATSHPERPGVRARLELETALRAAAVDAERIDAVVERARRDAWDEVSGPLASRAIGTASDAPDITPAERAERVGAFVALDLTLLAAERGVSLE